MITAFVSFAGLTTLVFGIALSELLEPELKVIILAFSIINFVVSIMTAVYIDCKNGKYKCKNCGKEFMPSMIHYILSPHIGSKRYLKCPECDEKSWCKKAD